MQWHFEKRGRLRFYRKIRLEGRVLLLGFGMAGEEEVEVRIDFASAARARAAAEHWAALARGAAFAEVALGSGTPGILYYFQGERGPGRIRVDGNLAGEVYFSAAANELPKCRVGQRVMVHGIHENP